MMSNNLFIIAKYSYNYLLYSAAAFAVFYIFGFEFLATIAFFVVLFFVYTFRNPERELQNFDSSSVLAPCDGVVTAIEELEEGAYRYKVEIESSITDVGILRAPINGKVTNVLLAKGTKVKKASKLFHDLNESLTIEFTDEKDNSVKVVHRLKQSAVPIFSDLVESQNVMKSMRYGFASNCVTTIYLKNNVRLNLQLSQQITASQSLIAYFS
ncbi:phosphatidylserine decarboxylase [Sulfurimonas sp. C5]|uniref:phosphatidylserine decarboxylase n=1 Tax=Sulfurimonas sp. C5 TaxID=3036947 RepID=UPI002455EE1E|nr:phosphatidylserine decarboxylase [Sulfurimonas sp. C5]MDH4945053.1 phosphatidylserine decarboxylase [Sulfurimonas sp. C5]